MFKKYLPYIYIGSVFAIVIGAGLFYSQKSNNTPNVGISTYQVSQGGTGATSFTVGECLVGNGTGAITTSACGAGGGSDPFTHPAAGQSATTSLMVLNGQASTTQLTTTGSTYLATTGGNVGIGTTTPNVNLSLDGNITSPFTSTANSSVISIRNSSNNSVSPSFIESDVQGALSIGVTANSVAAAIKFWTMDGAMGERMTIEANGNVGIGTSTPYAKLSVNGRGVFNQDIRADFFTATSTTQASTFTNASTSLLTVSTKLWLVNASSTGTISTKEICFTDVNQCMSAPSITGTLISLFHHNVASEIATYETLLSYPPTGTEIDETCSADADVAGGYCDIDSYISTTTDIMLTTIPSGTWDFRKYTYVSNAVGNTKLESNVYKRDVAGTETLLFQATSTSIEDTSLSLKEYTSAQGAFSISSTDRIVIKLKGWTDSSAAIVVHHVYGSTNHYSRIVTPITIENTGLANIFHDETISGAWTFNGKATFTNASSTLQTATTLWSTNLYLGTDGLVTSLIGEGLKVTSNALTFACSEVEGTGINCVGEDITLDATGDWTGTIDGNNFAGGAIGAGELLYGSGAGTIAELGAGTAGTILMSGGTLTPSWVSTSTFALTNKANTFTLLQTFGNSSTTAASFAYASSTNAYWGNMTVNGTINWGTQTGVMVVNNGTVSAVATSSNGLGLKKHFTVTWPSSNQSATTTTATSTIPLGVAYEAQTFLGVTCFSLANTVGYEISDGTNKMNFLQATTTRSNFALTTNNSFIAQETRYLLVGPMTASNISCTIEYK